MAAGDFSDTCDEGKYSIVLHNSGIAMNHGRTGLAIKRDTQFVGRVWGCPNWTAQLSLFLALGPLLVRHVA
jgi:hypothetical protein